MGGEAGHGSLAGRATATRFGWAVSGSLGVHQSDRCARNTIDASLGSASTAGFGVGGNRQQAISLNADLSYAVTDKIDVADGTEYRDEHFGPPKAIPRLGRSVRSIRGVSSPAPAPPPATDRRTRATGSRYNVAGYGDVALTIVDVFSTPPAGLRVDSLQDFGCQRTVRSPAAIAFIAESLYLDAD